MTGCLPSPTGRNTSARSTRPSSIVIGTSQSMRMPSRVSERSVISYSRLSSVPSRSERGEGGERSEPGEGVSPTSLAALVRHPLPQAGEGKKALPLHTRHRLKNRAHRAGVLVRVPGGERRAIDRLGRGEQRRRAANARRIFADYLHVLLPGRDAHGEIVAVVAILHHHRGTQLEYARVSGPGLDQLEDLRRIEPGLHAE